jgi:hypothetical protein
MLSRVGSVTVCSDKGRVRGAVGCRWADRVIHNLTSRLNGLSANLLVLHPALLMLNRVALLFKDSLALLFSLSGAHLLLVSVADVLIYSGALFFLGGLTVLFRDSATDRVRYNGAGALLDSGANILVGCVAFLLWHVVAHILIFWMAFFVADWMTLLLVSCCTRFLLNCSAVLLWHLLALLSVDCRAHLWLDRTTDIVTFWFVEALVVVPLVLGHLLQLATVSHSTSTEGIGDDSSKQARHHPEELHVAQQIHLVRKWPSQQAS